MTQNLNEGFLNIDATLTDIRKHAEIVRDHDAALTEAVVTEHKAEADLLGHALFLAGPALRAVGSRMVERYTSTGRGTERFTESTVHTEHRYMFLAGDDCAQPGEVGGDAGTFDGAGLFVREDEQLVVATWSGTWRRTTGGGQVIHTQLEPLSALQAVCRWALDTCLVSLRDALVRQAQGSKPKRTVAAFVRAERLRAIAVLAGKR